MSADFWDDLSPDEGRLASTIFGDIEAIGELAEAMDAPEPPCPWCWPGEPCWWHRAWLPNQEDRAA